MSFDWTVSIGNLITAAGFIVGASGVVWAIKGDVRILTLDIASMKAQLNKLTEVLIEIGKMTQRLDDHSRRISKLEDKE